jgi:hypothetical protein
LSYRRKVLLDKHFVPEGAFFASPGRGRPVAQRWSSHFVGHFGIAGVLKGDGAAVWWALSTPEELSA